MKYKKKNIIKNKIEKSGPKIPNIIHPIVDKKICIIDNISKTLKLEILKKKESWY
jgi:hypothetical protein